MATANKNVNFYIKSAIGVIIMVFFGLLPPIGEITPMGMHVLGIYIGLLYMWTAVDMIWPSFLGMFLLGIRGFNTIPGLITAGWGDNTNVFIAAIFMFAYFIVKSGVSDILVNSILSRKFARGKPWMISFLFLLAAYTVGVLVSLTPAALIVWAVFTRFSKEVGFKKGDAYPIIMIIGICLAALMGFTLFPFRPPASILIGMATSLDINVPFFNFVVTAFLIGWGSLAAYLLVAKFVFRPDVSLLVKEYEFEKAEKMTPYQKQIIFFTILWIILLTLQSAFANTAIGAFFAQFGAVGITLGLLMIMAILRTKDGNPFVDLLEAAKHGVSWSIFFLLTVGMPIGFALGDAELGFGSTLQIVLDPIFYREGGMFIFAIAVVFFSVLGTTLMLNHISAMLLYGIVILYAGRLGINLALLVAMLGITCNASFLLPFSNPVAAVMHGMRDWVTTKEILKYGLPLALLFTIVSSIVFLIGDGLLF